MKESRKKDAHTAGNSLQHQNKHRVVLVGHHMKSIYRLSFASPIKTKPRANPSASSPKPITSSCSERERLTLYIYIHTTLARALEQVCLISLSFSCPTVAHFFHCGLAMHSQRKGHKKKCNKKKSPYSLTTTKGSSSVILMRWLGYIHRLSRRLEAVPLQIYYIHCVTVHRWAAVRSSPGAVLDDAQMIAEQQHGQLYRAADMQGTNPALCMYIYIYYFVHTERERGSIEKSAAHCTCARRCSSLGTRLCTERERVDRFDFDVNTGVSALYTRAADTRALYSDFSLLPLYWWEARYWFCSRAHRREELDIYMYIYKESCIELMYIHIYTSTLWCV